MTTSSKAVLVAVLLSLRLAQAEVRVESQLACSEHVQMVPIVLLAPDCFAACLQVCAPLATAVTLAAQGKDPKPTICAHLDAMTCILGPAHQNVCGGLPKKANDLGAAVPLTTEGLRAMCGVGSSSALHLDAPGPLLGSELGQALNETSITTTLPSAALSAASGMGPWGAVPLVLAVAVGASTA